jgi:Mn2+/Fe2+ NRAMP family transporter
VAGAAAGRWIDEKLGTGIVFSLILICLGIAGGIVGAYRLVVAVQKKTNRRQR